MLQGIGMLLLVSTCNRNAMNIIESMIMPVYCMELPRLNAERIKIALLQLVDEATNAAPPCV